jgi:hypothetical protein
VTSNSAEQLQRLRDALLALHKALVDSERVSYESTMGSVGSPNDFLRLLTSDPWFAWLQPLARVIVSMDEALEQKQPLTDEGIESLLKQTRAVLQVSESDEGSAKDYFDALQRDPDVILAHRDVARLLAGFTTGGN